MRLKWVLAAITVSSAVMALGQGALASTKPSAAVGKSVTHPYPQGRHTYFFTTKRSPAPRVSQSVSNLQATPVVQGFALSWKTSPANLPVDVVVKNSTPCVATTLDAVEVHLYAVNSPQTVSGLRVTCQYQVQLVQPGTTQQLAGGFILLGSPKVGVPQPPSNPVVTDSANGTAVVTWGASTVGDGGDPDVRFKVCVSGGTTTSKCLDPTSTTTTMLTGLAVNQIYTVSVTEGHLKGTYSPPARTSFFESGPPTKPSVTPTIGHNQVTLALSDATPGVTSYRVHVSSPARDVSCVAGVPCVLDGLTDYATYQIQVYASNQYGESTSFAKLSIEPLPQTPIVTSFATTPGDSHIAVTYSLSALGSTIDCVTVKAMLTAPSSTPPCVATTAKPCTTSCAVSLGATNGTTYQVVLVIGYHQGSSTKSQVVMPTPQTSFAASVPAAPLVTSATPSDGSVTLTWSPQVSPSDAVAPTQYYNVYDAHGNLIASTTQTMYAVPALTNGTPYTFRVSAVNQMGEGPHALSGSAVIPFGKPFAPTNVTTTPSDRTIVVQWSWAASSDNGRTVTGFVVTGDRGDSCSTSSESQLSCHVSVPANGYTESFYVVATNVAGSSSPSNLVSGYAATRPNSPSSITVNPKSTSVALSWNAGWAGGAPTQSFVFGAQQCPTTTATSCMWANLSPSTNYRVCISAQNAVGSSSPSCVTFRTWPDSLSSENSSTSCSFGCLQPGDQLWSDNGRYFTVYQSDGNVVEYDSANGQPLWATGIDGCGVNNVFSFNFDTIGCFGYANHPWVYQNSVSGLAPLGCMSFPVNCFASGTANLSMQDDGNLVLYGSGTDSCVPNYDGSGYDASSWSNMALWTSRSGPLLPWWSNWGPQPPPPWWSSGGAQPQGVRCVNTWSDWNWNPQSISYADPSVCSSGATNLLIPDGYEDGRYSNWPDSASFTHGFNDLNRVNVLIRVRHANCGALGHVAWLRFTIYGSNRGDYIVPYAWNMLCDANGNNCSTPPNQTIAGLADRSSNTDGWTNTVPLRVQSGSSSGIESLCWDFSVYDKSGAFVGTENWGNGKRCSFAVRAIVGHTIE